MFCSIPSVHLLHTKALISIYPLHKEENQVHYISIVFCPFQLLNQQQIFTDSGTNIMPLEATPTAYLPIS